MKYLVILGDGMADEPFLLFGNKTPLDVAKKPNIDFLAQNGTIGLVKTVPQGYPCGSDTANLGVMGYDQTLYYTGRSPIEAVSMGIVMQPGDLSFRCNLVNITDEEKLADCMMIDYSSDEISSEEAAVLVESLNREYIPLGYTLYAGIGYRHCLIMHNASTGTVCIPPHDIMDKRVGAYLPINGYANILITMMEQSRAILANHPVNLQRIADSKKPANCAWFWGDGTRPSLPPFHEKFGVEGGVVSAVDLIKGIGICAKMKIAEVPGATGNIHTNYKGKADAALEMLHNGCDLVYLHIEAPDECGHRYEPENKVLSIELIDEKIVGYLLPKLRESGEPFSILVLPDHPTPLALRTHTSDPVPFVLYRSNALGTHPAPVYSESEAAKTGLYIEKGYELMGEFINNTRQ